MKYNHPNTQKCGLFFIALDFMLSHACRIQIKDHMIQKPSVSLKSNTFSKCVRNNLHKNIPKWLKTLIANTKNTLCLSLTVSQRFNLYISILSCCLQVKTNALLQYLITSIMLAFCQNSFLFQLIYSFQQRNMQLLLRYVSHTFFHTSFFIGEGVSFLELTYR